MLKTKDIPVVTEILFGTAKPTKFSAETLAVLLNPETTPGKFMSFCATSNGTWREIANAVVAGIASASHEDLYHRPALEPYHITIQLGLYLRQEKLCPEAQKELCPNPRPEFIAGCFLGLFEAGMWVGNWEQNGVQTGFVQELHRTIWLAVQCTNGFLERADPCLDDRFRSELTGAIKRYLSDPLDAGGLRFANTEHLLRDITGLVEKEKRVFPALINIILDGLTYGLIGRLTPLGRAQLIAKAAPAVDSVMGLWKLTKE